MGRRTLSREKAEEILRNDEAGELYEALRRLPDDVDPRLAANAVLSFLDRGKNVWWMGRHCQRLPAPVIRVSTWSFPSP